MNKRACVPFLIAITILFVIVACDDTTKKEAKPSEEWSRGLFLGENVSGAIDILAIGDGEEVHIAWPTRMENESRIRYVKLDRNGQKLLDQTLGFEGSLRNPVLIEAAAGNLHLIWSSRPAGDSEWTLWHGLLDANGDVVEGPALLHDGGTGLGKFVVEPDGEKGTVIAWDGGDQGELYIMHVDPEGRIIAGPSLVTEEGEIPSMKVSPAGDAHISWLSDGGFHYKPVTLTDLRVGEETQVVIPTHVNYGPTGDVMVGPVLAYEDGWVYIFWSIQSNTDVEMGSATTEYIVFHEDEVQSKLPSVLRMLDTEEQPYYPFEGELSLAQLVVPPDLSTSNTNFIINPSAMKGDNENLAIGLIAGQPFNLERQLQSVVAVFDDGQYSGYTIAGKTEQISDEPTLAVDGSGNLHMVWREGPGGRKAYYATTASTALAMLDRLEADDVLTALPKGIMDSFASLAFVPFVGLCWMLPGFLLIGVWSLAKEAEGIGDRASRVLIVVAIAIYYFMKFLFLPSMVTYTPFSAWMYIPESLSMLLRILIPFLIFAIAFFVAFAIRMRYTKSLLVVYLAFVLTDAALSLAVYGVNFQGSF